MTAKEKQSIDMFSHGNKAKYQLLCKKHHLTLIYWFMEGKSIATSHQKKLSLMFQMLSEYTCFDQISERMNVEYVKTVSDHADGFATDAELQVLNKMKE